MTWSRFSAAWACCTAAGGRYKGHRPSGSPPSPPARCSPGRCCWGRARAAGMSWISAEADCSSSPAISANQRTDNITIGQSENINYHLSLGSDHWLGAPGVRGGSPGWLLGLGGRGAVMMMTSITLIAGEHFSVGLALTAAKRHKLDLSLTTLSRPHLLTA